MKTTKEDVPVFSPGGTYSATVWSNVEGDRGNTQVIVECPASGTGAGVFALPLPHVPLQLRWESETHLVIAHPKEIHPHPGDGLAKQEHLQFADPSALAELTQGLRNGGSELTPDAYLELLKSAQMRSEKSAHRLTIRYEEYGGAGDTIATLRHKEQSALPPKPAENLLTDKFRGRLVASADGQFLYDYYDAHEQDSLASSLQDKGYQGGGESWAGIVYGLLKLHEPDVLQQVSFDPEADGLRIRSASRSTLTRVAELVTKAHGNPKLLAEAIEAAEADSEME